ncbi:IS3 family transposase [Turicibacter sanguinis]|uniref:IS3 family transposase n=1 Tax=Turicibacter sanguinis TaxID=154288 RepID=UPI00189CDADB|nr:IS3 family transposase [Turicibacter sanguinis]
MKQENPDQELENLILSIFKENDENDGYRRIIDELHHRGHQVNHKKVYRLMKKLGIICVKFSNKTRKYLSYKEKIGPSQEIESIADSILPILIKKSQQM